MERGRKNRRNMKKQVARKPTTVAQTIRRRILFTAGSGALSTTAPAGRGAAFAAGGNGGFTAGIGLAGVPAATVSPGCEVLALSGARSESSGLSTMRFLQGKIGDVHYDAAIECKLYNSPHCREHSLRWYKYSSIHEERRAS